MKICISVRTAQKDSLVKFIAEIPDAELAGLDAEDRQNVINDWAKDALMESSAWSWSYEVKDGNLQHST